MNQKEKAKAGLDLLPATLYEADPKACRRINLSRRRSGEKVAERYIAAKQLEWDEYKSQVTQWEIERYLHKY